MNILLISYYFSPGTDGTATVFMNIAELLAKNGNKVCVITNNFENVKYPEHENITIFFNSKPKRLPEIRKTSLIDTIRFTIRTIKVGLTLCKEEKIEIIHSNAIASIAGSFISLLRSIPHIVTIHQLYTTRGFWDEWVKEKGNTKLKAFLGKILEKLQVELKSDAIHTVSDILHEHLIKFGVKKKIYVIYNAIPVKNLESVDIVPNQFVVVGRLVNYKNVQVLIKAIKIVKKVYPNVSLIIAGDGPYRKNLEKLTTQLELNENVIFKGRVTEMEKNHLIASSQAFLFPSYFESFGVVILEAFLHKKPVLTSDVRPMSEIVKDKKTGLLVSTHNEKEWAKTIEYALSHPEEIAKMGERGRKVLENNYTIDKLGKQILEMYKDVLK